ncbi:MAG: Carotenogenesis protein CarS [Myxococcota bacterium]|nr:Carotenogenesis protein CarS [Myxococcota bacterium]
MTRAKALELRHSVPGAPLEVGQWVRVRADAGSETLDYRFLGQRGRVLALIYDDPLAQFPQDPLVQVEVAGLGSDLFFVHELKAQPVAGSGRTEAGPAS